MTAHRNKEGTDRLGALAWWLYLNLYCNNEPFSGSCFASSGGMTTAAATLSSSSRFSSFTPWVERPASRIV